MTVTSSQNWFRHYSLLPSMLLTNIVFAVCRGWRWGWAVVWIRSLYWDGAQVVAMMTSTLLALCEENPLVNGGFPSQRTSNGKLWCCMWYTPEQKVEKTLELLVNWVDMTLIRRHWNDLDIIYEAPRVEAIQVAECLIMPWIGVYDGEMDVIQWTW